MTAWKHDTQKVQDSVKTANGTVHKWLHEQIHLQPGRIEGDVLDFIRNLPIFKPVLGTMRNGIFLSAKKARSIYLMDNCCLAIDRLLEKVYFSKPIIQIDSDSSIFINIMGLKIASIFDIISVIFGDIEKKIYNDYEVDQILDWIFENFNELKGQNVSFNKLQPDLLHQRFTQIAKEDPIDQRKYEGCCGVLLLTKNITNISDSFIIPCKHSKLHQSNELVFGCQLQNTCKYVCSVANWLTGPCHDFLRICHVKTILDTEIMAEIVRKIWEKNKTIKLIGKEWDAFIEIMEELHNKTAREPRNYIYNLEMPLPNKDGILQHAEDLLFDDVMAYGNKFEQGRKLLGPIALHFGVKTESDRELEEFEETEDGMNTEDGEEFGQEVDLVQRIRQLLDQYHGESDMIQEFLQNADDARATKVAFLLDERMHSCENMLSHNWNKLQGPALLVYNDSKFTKEDIRGIQQLGLGSKSNDPEKIGHYGAGFNCCYRYSDCPSFISGDDILCIFDPIRYYLTAKRNQKGGRKFSLSDRGTGQNFKDKYPSIYKSYQIEGFNLKNGTMFRLPLRLLTEHYNCESGRQFVQDDEFHTAENVLTMLNNVANVVKKSMLFLRNVSEIAAYHIDGQNRLAKKLWHFQVETEHVKWLTKRDFSQDIKTKNPFSISVDRSVYKMLIVDMKNDEKDKEDGKEEWLIAQRIGFQTKSHEVDFSKVRLLPIAGVAYNNMHEHQLYCLLPMPQMSGLQVSINGHFSLDSEGRKNLFTPVNGQLDVRQQWNDMLLYDIAVNAYLDLLEVRKLSLMDSTADVHEVKNLLELLEEYWMILPNIGAAHFDKTGQTWPERQKFADKVFKELANTDRKLIPTISKDENDVTAIVWLKIVSNQINPIFPDGPLFPDPRILSSNKDDHIIYRAKMFVLFHELGLKVVPCPLFVMEGLKRVQIDFSIANPIVIANYLRGSWAKHIKLPCQVNHTQLQTEEIATELLKFILEGIRKDLQLDGVPLLITEDKLLRQFSTKSPVLVEKLGQLMNIFPQSASKFAIQEMNHLLTDYQERRQKHLLEKDLTLSILQLDDLILMAKLELPSHGLEPIDSCCLEINFEEEWMKIFWSLIIRLTKNHEEMEHFTKEFKTWPLIPAKFSQEAPACVFRLDSASWLVRNSLWNMVSPNIFLKGLPIVEAQYFTAEAEAMMFCGSANKARLINVIDFWQNGMKMLEWPSNIKEHYQLATVILRFFTKYFNAIEHNAIWLRKLNIFETIEGTFVELNDLTCYTTDENENDDLHLGPQIWSSRLNMTNKSNVLLLRKRPEFQKLYQQVGIKHESLADMFVVILEKEIFTNMETEEQLTFLQILYHYSNKKEFRHPLDILKRTKFIRFHDGEIENKKAFHELCDKETDLFKIMKEAGFLSNDNFLPSEFELVIKENQNLLSFFKELGLKIAPTIKQLKKCASDVSSLEPEEQIEAARLIVKSVAENFDEKEDAWYSCIARLSMIEFIPPEEEDSDLEALCPRKQTYSVKTLMKPKSSLISRYWLLSSSRNTGLCKHQNLVWSVMQTLPEWFSTFAPLHKAFEVSELPNFSDVLKHFTNLFQYQYEKHLFPDTSTLPQKSKLKEVLESFYAILDYYLSHVDDVKEKVIKLPLIYVEEQQRCHLAFPSMVVERLPKHLHDHHPPGLPPFLYELPQILGAHRPLFRVIGMQKEATISHYIRFMQMVVESQSPNHLSQKTFSSKFTEWDDVLKSSVTIAQEIIVRYASEEALSWNDVKTLYLLGTDRRLHLCKDLVFRDDYSMSMILTKNFIFWWFPESATEPSLAEKRLFVESLPPWMEMKCLSNLITKRVSVKSVPCKEPLCPVVRLLRNMLGSPEFIKAIKRLYFDENETTKLLNGSWENVQEELMNIEINCYQELWIAQQNCEVPNLEAATEKRPCFISGSPERKVLGICHQYCAKSTNKFPYHLSKNLLPLLHLEHSEVGLTELFDCKNPSMFEGLLDQLEIPPLAHDESRMAVSIPTDPPDPLLAEKFWTTAINDFKGAEALLNCKKQTKIGENIGNEHIVILTQQAVEKALKAVLLAQTWSVEETHDLSYLAQRVDQSTAAHVSDRIGAFTKECHVVLTRLRYPDNRTIPRERYNSKQAEKAISYSNDIIEMLKPFTGQNCGNRSRTLDLDLD